MFKPWLLLPPKLAHDLAPLGLQVLASFREAKPPVWRTFEWRSIHFPNRLGIAGGVDKDGDRIEDWWALGAGFVEIGTVTPLPQKPNPGRIIDRDLESLAIWNKMGFPGKGMWHVRANLLDLPGAQAAPNANGESIKRPAPLFVNIGKNRMTPNEEAARDYAACIETLSGLCDAFVVNISSPNTKGLRDLFKPEIFRAFLKPVVAARRQSATKDTPILLKLSPDLSDTDLSNVVTEALAMEIDGFIATNTTLERTAKSKFAQAEYAHEGGVSGKPLAARSKVVLSRILQLMGSERSKKLVVSTGGVMTPEDVFERLDLGADLVQVYSALIFHGPNFFRHVARKVPGTFFGCGASEKGTRYPP